MPNKYRPSAVQLDKAGRRLVIPWSDGHQSEYGWNSLRESCPCVSCRSDETNGGISPDQDVFILKPTIGYEIDAVKLVGNYALQITWSDGHDTGIYTWDYLRYLPY